MLLGDCNHCDSLLPIRGNRFALLFGRSYFCGHCGHPGPSLKDALGKRLRRGYTDQSQSTLEGKETSITL
ncbi:hypothetical protein A7E78_03980 [Syntrophotalea acetylenivorans]|uniref:Uncharacterized protein n=1 Tax=Syntrophotalea acetylenivorans TaxID=1842532 RepID=A0A1L3GME9_9BACT|nr:hypothetical protein [Syntrophotalea acetylenivorans]APG27065.1 hypothetical protein A7E78_03980 [Syntrophotalea acetylenivorans]